MSKERGAPGLVRPPISPPYEGPEGKRPEGEGSKTQKTQDRHLKDTGHVPDGDGVNPFGIGPVIPKLPEKSAYIPGKQNNQGPTKFP